jgi:adenylate cyclase
MRNETLGAVHMPDETSARPDRYELLDCTLDLDRCALLRRQEEVRLRGRSFDVLTYLVGHAKRVVGKQELMDDVWD